MYQILRFVYLLKLVLLYSVAGKSRAVQQMRQIVVVCEQQNCVQMDQKTCSHLLC